MSSPAEPSSPHSFTWVPSSQYFASLTESYALLNEKLDVPYHVRKIPVRHRAWWLLLSMTALGTLFANLVWNFAPRIFEQASVEPTEAQIIWDIGGSDQDRFQLPDNVRVVALVSYTARSRTSILDCYLQSNLVSNDGLLDQVIFIPETGQERDMDWLYALVQSTPGYYMLGKPKHEDSDDPNHVPVPGAPGAHVSEQDLGSGPFARAWNLALSVSQSNAPHEEQSDDSLVLGSSSPPDPSISTIYVFIHGETIFLAHDAISHLLQTHFAHPSYAFVHANIINQPVLSWIHHHLGVVRPYRPETEPPLRLHRNRTSARVREKEKADIQHSWRASELPLWRDSHRTQEFAQNKQSPDEDSSEQPQDFPPTDGPALFNIPIDFHSPFRGHRWLPYHPYKHHPLTETLPDGDTNRDTSADSESESIATPITQAMMSLSRPGKWPWTLSALHLYSFLEHLECTAPSSFSLNNTANTGKYQLNCTTIGGLERYDMGLWEYQSERYGMSIFAVSERMIAKIGALQNGVSEEEVLGRSGRGAVVDGGAVGVRFVGDGESEMRGLQSTDLLERFRSVGSEMGGCEGEFALMV